MNIDWREGKVPELMNVVVSVLLLLLVGWSNAWAQSPVSKLEKVPLSGYDYVRLTDWARANRFELRWRQKGEELEITGRNTRLLFRVTSRRVELNGLSVLLSMPVAMRNGVAHISSVDLHSTLHPILFPQKSPTGKRIKVICLDPGHGGKDPGNMEGGNREKDYTLLLALEINQLLKKAGLAVVMTRSSDRFVELPERPELANRSGADLFVSLHFNAIASPEVRGAQTYCMTPAYTSSSNSQREGAHLGSFPGNLHNDRNMLLAFQVHKALVQTLRMEDMGLRRARFNVLREARMPSVLVEGAFMSHPLDRKKIYDSAARRQMARAIVDGILSYKRMVES